MNPVRQLVPRQQLPDAIINGHATGYLWDGMCQEAQFAPFTYPMPGYSPIHMIYRYGGSAFQHRDQIWPLGGGLSARKHRIRRQSVDLDGRRGAVRRHHPAGLHVVGALGHRRMVQCRTAMRSTTATACLNHRVVTLQHKCIEPLGESRSDYDIFCGILAQAWARLDVRRRRPRSRLGQAGVRFFRPRPNDVSWKDFCREGLFRRSARRGSRP